MKKIYTKTLVLRIDPKLNADLKEISEKKQTPVARIVRDILKETILKENTRNTVFDY